MNERQMISWAMVSANVNSIKLIHRLFLALSLSFIKHIMITIEFTCLSSDWCQFIIISLVEKCKILFIASSKTNHRFYELWPEWWDKMAKILKLIHETHGLVDDVVSFVCVCVCVFFFKEEKRHSTWILYQLHLVDQLEAQSSSNIDNDLWMAI